VLGGAVMLGVPAGPKKQNRNSMPPMSTLTAATTNTLPQRGPLPNFDLATAPRQAMA